MLSNDGVALTGHCRLSPSNSKTLVYQCWPGLCSLSAPEGMRKWVEDPLVLVTSPLLDEWSAFVLSVVLPAVVSSSGPFLVTRSYRSQSPATRLVQAHFKRSKLKRPCSSRFELISHQCLNAFNTIIDPHSPFIHPTLSHSFRHASGLMSSCPPSRICVRMCVCVCVCVCMCSLLVVLTASSS